MNYTYAQRFNNISGSVIREIFKLLADPTIISFAGGAPSTDALPNEMIAEFTQKLLQDDSAKMLQYGISEGYAPLRESIAGWAEHLGIQTTAEGILITSGGQQGIDLMLKAFLDPGDRVLVEEPTFLATLNAIKSYQGIAVGVPMDDEGINLQALETALQQHKPKLLYIIPTFQNPTGRTMTLSRRKAVLELADRYNVPIMEDDPYRDLRYRGETVPTLKSMDSTGRVAYIGSFSKLISPGLRVGYIIPPADMLRPLVIGKQVADVHTPTLNQAVVDQILRTGRLMPHVQTNIPRYLAKLDAMLETLLAKMPQGLSWTYPEGGLFVWLTLPDTVSGHAVFQRALDKKVACIPGEPFYVNGGAHQLRLNFSASTIEQIGEGITRLSEAVVEEMNA